MQRRVYPYGAWPASELRPWESNIPLEENPWAPSRSQAPLVRSDPLLLPLGARMKRTVYANAPAGLQADEFAVAVDPSAKPVKKKMDRAENGGEERTVMDLVLAELDKQLPPVFHNLIELLRGRYFLEAKPSPPPVSSLSIIG